jgi:hypothetical protein
LVAPVTARKRRMIVANIVIAFVFRAIHVRYMKVF